MSSKWDKMDKIVWNKSEVMREFEKNILNSIQSASKKIDDKIAAANLSKIPEDLAKVNQQAGTAATNLSNIANAIKKIYSPSADDGQINEESLETIHEIIKHLNSLKNILIKQEESEVVEKIQKTIKDLEKTFKQADEVEESKETEEKESLIKELTSLAHSLADQKETVLAYKVERIIREIEESGDEG